MIDRTHLFFCFLLTATTLSSGCSQSPETSVRQQPAIVSSNPVSQQVNLTPKKHDNQNQIAQTSNATFNTNETQNQILLEAVQNQDFEKVKTALANSADANTINPAGITALMFAAMNGHLDIFNTLLEVGANVNIDSAQGETALMFAAGGGHLEIAQILIEKGADVNIQDVEIGMTALMRAAGLGHIEIVILLLDNGADVSTKSYYGGTALTIAQDNGYPKIVELLKQVDSGIFLRPNTTDENTRSDN